MTPFRENVRGIVAITACNVLFLFNDTLIRLTSEREHLPLSEILLIRGLLASAVLAPIVLATGAGKRVALVRSWPLFWRTAAEVFAAFLYLFALFHMPIANLNAILQVVPLLLTGAAALFLGERVGWRRWAAIAVGFAGVLVVIRPGFGGFDAYALVALAAMFFITLRDFCTRLIPSGLPALVIALVTSAAVGLSGPLLGLLLQDAWIMPSGMALAMIVGAVFFAIGGYLSAVAFMRHGDIAVVAPFRYSVIVAAILVGYLVWGDVPDWPMLAGTAIIISAGIYTLYRERNASMLAAEAAAGEGL